MAARPDKARERASEEATDWLILLQDEPDDPDLLRRFNAWRAENPVNVAAWAMTERTSGAIARVSPVYADRWQPFVTAEREGKAARLSTGRRGSQVGRARRCSRGLAALAVAACLAFLVLPAVVLQLKADYTTATGEMRTVQFDDGSTAALAPDSALAIAYTGAERRVTLLAGEAFFETVHDAARPFRVGADGIETTDLGTAFDVRRGKEGAAIAVQHGSVQVDYRSAAPPVSETLRAGQSVRVAWTEETVRTDAPPTQIAAWHRNQLIAQDQPMREVVDQLRPYFAGRIILINAALADRSVTGVYNLTDPVEALRGIARAHGATVRRITPWILVVSDG